MNLLKDLKTHTHRFMRDYDISKTVFGIKALKNPHALFQYFEQGVDLKMSTAQRMYDFIDKYRKKHDPQA